MLLSMLMLLYVDDLVLLAPSRSDLTTALEELERIMREWGMAVNYPKTEAEGGGCPARCRHRCTASRRCSPLSWR